MLSTISGDRSFLTFLSLFLSQLVQEISEADQLVLHAFKAWMQPLYQVFDTLLVEGKSINIPYHMAKT